MKIGACYIRVSTADQTEYSPESQLRMIKDYAGKNDIIIPEEFIYRDEGISGRTAEKRPAFQKMISEAKQKKFELILIYSTSRFARNHEQSIVYRSMLEKECGIEVISITQPNIDKKTDMLTTAIYSIMDEWYSMDLSDNVRRGMTEKALKGEYQALPPFGYEQTYKGAVMTIKEDEAKVVKYIFEQFLNNKSKWVIARELKSQGIKTKRGSDLTTRSIYYILRNPAYKGYSRWTPTNKIRWDFGNENTLVVKGKHDPIIDEQTFDEIQKRLDDQEEITKAKARPQESMKHWLSGLMKCSDCGQSLIYSGVTPKRKNACFRCGGYNRGTCKTMNFITTKEAEDHIISFLQKVSSDLDELYKINIKQQNIDFGQIDNLEKEYKKNKNKLERAKQGFLNGLFEIKEYRDIKESCEKEMADIQKNISSLNNQKVDYLSMQLDIEDIYNVLINDEFDKSKKQTAIRSIVKEIVFDKKTRKFTVYFYR